MGFDGSNGHCRKSEPPLYFSAYHEISSTRPLRRVFGNTWSEKES